METNLKIARLRRGLDHGIPVEIDGTRVDVLTAAAILTVYEDLPDWARREFSAEGVADMATMAWDVLRSSSRHGERAGPAAVVLRDALAESVF